MPNDWFRFRQFMIRQDRCAMKVGTDGVLLGSWCSAEGCRRILDAGTGTGFIALMCAQRSQAIITGIEIDLIVSNPPYFKDSLPSKNRERNFARHNTGISLDELVSSFINILEKKGKISLILPVSRFKEVNEMLREAGFCSNRIAKVASRPGDKDIRVMAEWTREGKDLEERQIYIYNEGSTEWHTTYKELTRDFYL